jgi:hypothetical protein
MAQGFRFAYNLYGAPERRISHILATNSEAFTAGEAVKLANGRWTKAGSTDAIAGFAAQKYRRWHGPNPRSGSSPRRRCVGSAVLRHAGRRFRGRCQRCSRCIGRSFRRFGNGIWRRNRSYRNQHQQEDVPGHREEPATVVMRG